ncbi:hypothetical protein DSOL_4262 [Desulfosporosinus metallidurans]|uniref:Uncharacterized protein n=1 Tax=Desulfosporosinus metallidurans TaxID=1888891 RepID=A0A1Q8QL03_9FIRM|nr:hypothetical protein DSOL_4262 [Desulfosporosinus metallidurans]
MEIAPKASLIVVNNILGRVKSYIEQFQQKEGYDEYCACWGP